MNETILKIFSLFALVIIAGVTLCIILDVLKVKHPFKDLISKYRLESVFLVSLIGTVGSILLSVYFKFAACELCWYQRMFLFSIPIITAIALIKNDTKAYVYAYYFALIGLFFSMYHALIQSKIFASDTVFCNPTSLIDCATPAFRYFGFVTVPVVAFSVFYLISYLAYVQNKK